MIENFAVYWSGSPISEVFPLGRPIPYANGYTDFPFGNTQVGQTSNMSYDIRGDPLIIPKYPFALNYSTLTPIYNRSLN